MNDDYLWDKTGEADPEIRQLEELLAPLRYQPRPLELPEELPLAPKRNYLPLLAIAATVVIALLAAGVWVRLRNEKVAPAPVQAKSAAPVPGPSVVHEETPTPVIAENRNVPNKPVHRHSSRTSKPGMTKVEREEALAAKQQVMLALRVASEKIKLAQRRTLTPSPNLIKNQHKLG